MVDKLKKRIEEMTYRENIFKPALFYSISKKSSKFPTDERYILSAFVNGVVDYIGGNSGKVNYRDSDMYAPFEENLYKYLLEEMNSCSGNKLDPRVKSAITRLCLPWRVYSRGPEMNYSRVEIYSHYEEIRDESIPLSNVRSSFSLPKEVKAKIRKKILPELLYPEVINVAGIGTAMRPHIEADLEHIAKNCRW